MNTSKLTANTRDSLLRKIAVFIGSCVYTSMTLAAPDLPRTPLGVTTNSPPITMLVSSKDHKLFYEAYNDASDLDDDGLLDTHFKPSIIYYGLFDSSLCYTYSNNLFEPSGIAGALGTCSGEWSGNWLNYMTTSRIDALRKVLYGGSREVDDSDKTILRRAYIPQDAHSWGKEYHTSHGYRIDDYTPLSQPSSGKRHFFGNLTPNAGRNCSTLDNCSDSRHPTLRIRTNVGDNHRVWEWASKERPVLAGSLSTGSFPNGTGNEQNFRVRVEVCTQTFNSGCKQYSNGTYKPVGLLHEYGEDGAMLFGLLTGSYNKNMSGGVLRQVIANFSDEVNASTGQFNSNAPIVNSFDALRIRDFNNGRTDNAYQGGWQTTRPMQQGEFVDWGNPLGEMMYETLRYLAGAGNATSSFSTTGGDDAHVGLPTVGWDDPFDQVEWCSKPNIIAISDINPSFDDDGVPGGYFGGGNSGVLGLNVENELDTITANEAGIVGDHFIGESGSVSDNAPTAKYVASLGSIRGLSPEEPTKKGTYSSAGVAYFAKRNDIRPNKEGKQSVDTFIVALASPLPKIEIPMAGGRTINLVPFAKSVGGSGISNDKNDFQPTDQIVDFYVDTVEYNSPSHGGRYYAKFRINYEDVEQGADHDMDAIAVYEVIEEANGTLTVNITPSYAAGGIKQNMGYIISGTTEDGIYLEVQDENTNIYYHLNTPPGRAPGYCANRPNNSSCQKLPNLPQNQSATRNFTPGTSAATLLEGPLWYAAKWGGFIDRNNNDIPDLNSEWDEDGDGVPDTYFLVQNPVKLRESLIKALDNIVARSAAAGNVTSNGQSISDDSFVFSTIFNSANWSGNLFSYRVDINGVSPTASWNAASKLPAPLSRSIYLSDGSSSLKPFTWSNLSTAERNALGTQQIVNWIRGERSREQQNGGDLRTRGQSVLGDFVHSSPYYAKDTDTVYVGANDGMLHAFDANTGVEQFAYIPSVFLNNLKNTANPNYGTATVPHDYFVDGDVVVTNSNQTPGENILIGTLGHGGKGLYALDVTTPTSFGTGDLLWERFDNTDTDLGFMLGRPQVAELNDGDHWAIVGNGYNSTSGRAVLYLINLDDNSVIKIDTEVGSNNGLSTPALFDEDDDGVVDYVYAGDLNGNMWKFDLSAKQTNKWDVAYKAGNTPVPLFTAKDGFGNPQPITAQPTVAIATGSTAPTPGARYVLFGTGSYFRTNDPHDDQMQSWYGIIDSGNDQMTRAQLKKRSIDARTDMNGTTVRTFETAATGDMTGMSGWYIDFDLADDLGERIVTSSKVYQFIEPVLIASSIIPVVDPCIPGGRGYINAVNPYTGGSLTVNFFDVNDDGVFNDELNNKPIGSFDPGVGMPSEHVIMGNRLVVGGSTGEVEDTLINTGGVKKTGRMSWREILQD